jgi:hypothetical protein
VKTTIDIPDEVLRTVESAAAVRGETVRDFVVEALEAHLRSGQKGHTGWRAVLGRAHADDVRAVDEVIAAEFETIDPADWQ